MVSSGCLFVYDLGIWSLSTMFEDDDNDDDEAVAEPFGTELSKLQNVTVNSRKSKFPPDNLNTIFPARGHTIKVAKYSWNQKNHVSSKAQEKIDSNLFSFSTLFSSSSY